MGDDRVTPPVAPAQAAQTERRFRLRISRVTRAGNLRRVRRLQKLMLPSRSNALLAVRRVTELKYWS
jgi:RNA-directed DNA polymerase